MYEQDFFQMIRNLKQQNESKGKFDIYSRIKRQSRRERYLTEIHNNQLRRNLAKIRCATNNIPINALGRYNVDKNLRHCTMCDNNELGTELHVIMKCENQDLIKIGEHFLQFIHNYSPQIESLI